MPSPDPALQPPPVVLAHELLEEIGSLRRGLRRATPSAWPRSELTGAQLEVLRLVRRHPGLSIREAAERLRLRPNTVSTLVGQLGDAGLVRRERDEADRRVARLVLTDEARTWLTAWRDERQTAMADALNRLDPADRKAVAAVVAPLRRLVAALDEHDG